MYGERLRKALELAGKTRRELARELGVTEQAVGQVINGRAVSLSAVNSAKAARYLHVSHYWLATGEGEPRSALELSPDAIAQAKTYESLSDRERGRFRAAMLLAMEPAPDERVAQYIKPPPATNKR